MVEQKLLSCIEKKVDDILETEEAQNNIKYEARQLIRDIQERTKEKIIKSVSERITAMTVGYHGYGLRNMIDETIVEMINPR